MAAIPAVPSISRQVGDPVQAYDLFGYHNTKQHIGTISKLTKKFVFVDYLGHTTKYHRATGFIVGYTFMYQHAIAPETF